MIKIQPSHIFKIKSISPAPLSLLNKAHFVFRSMLPDSHKKQKELYLPTHYIQSGIKTFYYSPDGLKKQTTTTTRLTAPDDGINLELINNTITKYLNL